MIGDDMSRSRIWEKRNRDNIPIEANAREVLSHARNVRSFIVTRVTISDRAGRWEK